MRSHLDVRSLRSRLLCFETASAEAAAVHRAYCMPLQFDCRTTGKRKRERLPAWQLNSNNRQSHNVFSLYGWLLARVQTGNYCIWIDSDVHVRSRCIAPAMFSHRFKLFFFWKFPPKHCPMPMRLGFGSCVQAMPSCFFAMHKVCLTLQLLRSVPSTWFKPPCALESCFFPALNVVQHATFAVAGTYIYIEILYCICFQTIYLFYTYYNCKLVPIRISQLLWREPCRPWKKIWSCFWPGMAFTKM